MATPKNGQLRVVRLAISAAFTNLITPTNADGTAKLFGNGKPQMWYTVSLLNCTHKGQSEAWFTVGQAEKLAEKAGADTTDSIKNAIAGSFEQNYIDITQKYCEVGAPITDDKGKPKVDADGDSIGDYKGDADGNSYWEDVANSASFALAEDAVEYLMNIQAELDKEDAREARNSKKAKIAKLRTSNLNVIVAETKKDKAQDEEEDEEEEDLTGGATPPVVLTAAQMKAENKAAKAAGKPEPHSAAAVKAAK